MATIEKFEDIEAWKTARLLCKEIHLITLNKPFCDDFKLKGQIKDSSGSSMDNIAEGFDRGGKQEFINFLGYARGSAGECRSQLYRAFDYGYIDSNKHKELHMMTLEISRMISGLIKYLKGSDKRGFKFH
ncbi:MAG: four helix bundle protein [Bacteroidales bacterium]|nr:four helix bundle protein [Bacteroidales bacterium]